MLLELGYPSAEKAHVNFQRAVGSQVKVDVIIEYHIILMSGIVYEDTEPADEDAVSYDRTTQISVVFYDARNPERQVFIDSVFKGRSLTKTVNRQAWSGVIRVGSVILPPQEEVSSNKVKAIYISFDNLGTNIIAQQTVLVPLGGAPPLPEPPDYRPVIIGVSLFALPLILGAVYAVVSRRRKRPWSIPDSPPPTPSEYSYAGRLNLYITQTEFDRDIPPLTCDLFRIPGGRTLTLQEILDSYNISEPLEGANRIYLKTGTNRCLVLSNESNCTIVQAREILMKGHGYPTGLDSEVDIIFEDEISEMVLRYRGVRPNELRGYART